MDSSQPPSVASLAHALSRTTGTEPPSSPGILLARPKPLTMVLIATALIMLLTVLAAIMVARIGIGGLVQDVRDQQGERDYRARLALPDDKVLLDEQGWRREVVARPLAAANLNLARCERLASAGRWADIVATVAAVKTDNPGTLLPTTRLLEAEALYKLKRFRESGAVLHAIDTEALTPPELARANQLAGQLWLAGPLPAGPKAPLPHVPEDAAEPAAE